jgi:elongation factor G
MSGDIARLRNIGIIAHIDAGKTTVTEGLLFFSGVERRMGRIDDGNTVMDYLPEERERGITITSAATTIPWKNFTVNIIDTPGHVDFTAEVERSLRVLDGAVVVFDAANGVEAQSETVWYRADRYGVPRICFINKMDRVGADFYMCVNSIRDRLGAKPVAIQIPLGTEKEHRGVVDLVSMKAFAFPGELSNKEYSEVPIPPDLADEAQIARDTLVDQVAEFDDSVCELYLSGKLIPEQDLKAAIRRGALSCSITPVLCGSGLRNVGLPFIMDAVGDFLPSPIDLPPVEGKDVEGKKSLKRKPDPDEPLAALAFKLICEKHGDLVLMRVYSGVLENGQAVFNPRLNKTERVMRLYRMHADHRIAIEQAGPGEIAGVSGFKETRTGDTLCLRQKPIVLESMHFPETVVSMAIEPRSSADKDRFAEALSKLVREDPTFTVKEDADTGQTVISGLGELHLEIIKHRLLSDYKVDANVGKPRVAYRQTIESPCAGRYVFEHQMPTRRQFAGVELKVEPWPESSKPVFVNTITKDQLPLHFWPHVEEGALAATQGGTGYGYPMINIRITLTGVQYNQSDSTEVAFSAAAAKAFDNAIDNGKPIILEPQMKIEVQVPDEFLGEILNDLNMRKAQITDVEQRGRMRVVKGVVSLTQMFGYATTVRSLSQGRAQPSMELYKYAPASSDVYEKFNF